MPAMRESTSSTRCCAYSTVRCEAAAPQPQTRITPTLTTRELEVLALLADGYRYEQVAIRLQISIGSVRTYVMRVYRKLNVSTKSEATALAMRSGMLR